MKRPLKPEVGHEEIGIHVYNDLKPIATWAASDHEKWDTTRGQHLTGLCKAAWVWRPGPRQPESECERACSVKRKAELREQIIETIIRSQPDYLQTKEVKKSKPNARFYGCDLTDSLELRLKAYRKASTHFRERSAEGMSRWSTGTGGYVEKHKWGRNKKLEEAANVFYEEHKLDGLKLPDDSTGRDSHVDHYETFFDKTLVKHGETEFCIDDQDGGYYSGAGELNPAFELRGVQSSWQAVERSQVYYKQGTRTRKAACKTWEERNYFPYVYTWSMRHTPDDGVLPVVVHTLTPAGVDWARRAGDNFAPPKPKKSTKTLRKPPTCTLPDDLIARVHIDPSILRIKPAELPPLREWDGDTSDPAYQEWLKLPAWAYSKY